MVLYNCKVLPLSKKMLYPVSGMFKDPVCNMMVDEEKAKFTSKVNDKKIYLCSEMCKSEFDADPSKFGY